MCSCLQLLDFEPGWKVWRSVNFLAHFLMFSIMLISVVNPPRRPKKAEGADGAKPSAAAKSADGLSTEVQKNGKKALNGHT
jgi:hypothetical protein